MNRIRKYRVFDKSSGKYLHSSPSNYYACTSDDVLEVKMTQSSEYIGMWDTTVRPVGTGGQYISEDFIGIQDNHGTDIYEGDIVDAFCRESQRKGKYYIHYDTEYCSYVGISISNNHNEPVGELRFDIEIIGDINQNQDMLTGLKL